MHQIQTNILAAEIATKDRGKPNLSMKYVDSEGVLKGYVLAWEGICTEAEQYRDKPIVYLMDMAFTDRNSASAGKLILSFLDQYKTKYIDTGILTPILADMRDQTSFKLLQRQVQKWEQQLGITIEVRKLEEYKAGPDTMHRVLLIPSRVSSK